MSKSKKKSPTASRSARAPRRPWVSGGVDYGPAIGAVADLATWAFDLAAGDVADWPEGRRRVMSARRHVLSRLRGKRTAHAPTEDILFAAGLMARIFEADLSLGMSDMVCILDQLGLPTEVVPLMPRRQASGRVASNVVAFARPQRPAHTEPEGAHCPGCPQRPRLRNAA